MAILVTFLLGIANFALHKAVLESRHPILAQLDWLFRPLGGRFSLLLEFMMLLGTLALAANGATGWAWAYALYTTMNGASAWMILTGRM